MSARILARIRCFIRNRHSPVRSMHGGFVCLECRFAGADLEEMGFPDGWVTVDRREYTERRG